MTDRIKELLLSESLEDNWLAVEILRALDKSDKDIITLILEGSMSNFDRYKRLFKLKFDRKEENIHYYNVVLRDNIIDKEKYIDY